MGEEEQERNDEYAESEVGGEERPKSSSISLEL